MFLKNFVNVKTRSRNFESYGINLCPLNGLSFGSNYVYFANASGRKVKVQISI
jgi:hypothetical protein